MRVRAEIVDLTADPCHLDEFNEFSFVSLIKKMEKLSALILDRRFAAATEGDNLSTWL